jgi:hypothetical protein
MTYPTATLKPAPGLVVRDPTTRQPLAEQGEPKPLDTYWCRRLFDGDVHQVPEPAVATKPAAKAASKALQGSAP